MGPITLTILTPLVGALLLGLAPRARERDVRAVGLVASLATFAASLWLLASFDTAEAGPAARRVVHLDPGIDARIAFAVDGVSLVLILLTTFLVPLILVASWRSVGDRFVGYTAAFLVLEAAVIGVFATTDLLLFYVLFEFTLVPMYLIIGIWGGRGTSCGRRQVLPLHPRRRPAHARRHPLPPRPDRHVRLRRHP
jgi:NADH-quinone oxidoreductase subunit M